MSSVPLGGITGETFGIASLITGFVHAIRTPKAVIEPKMIDMLALYGYPLSIAKLFKKLYISQ